MTRRHRVVSRVLLLLLLALLLAGPAGALAAPPHREPPAAPASRAAETCHRPDSRPGSPQPDRGRLGAPRGIAHLAFIGLGHDGDLTRDTVFSAGWLRDLHVVVRWNLCGSHTQRLELFSPDGALYQRFSTPFVSPDSGLRLETWIPVGGTWITEHALYGPWRVEVYLDRDPLPIVWDVFRLDP